MFNEQRRLQHFSRLRASVAAAGAHGPVSHHHVTRHEAWLVSQGASVEARVDNGEQPIHAAESVRSRRAHLYLPPAVLEAAGEVFTAEAFGQVLAGRSELDIGGGGPRAVEMGDPPVLPLRPRRRHRRCRRTCAAHT